MSVNSESKLKLMGQVVEGLKQKPAYLLIFGIDLLFVLFGIATGAVGVARNQETPLILGFCSFALALIVAAFVVKIVHVAPVAAPEPVQPQERRIQKLMYVKIEHLSKREDGKPAIYHRRVPRLGQDPIPVYDEAIFYGLTLVDRETPYYDVSYRSSGVVDLRVAHPWREKLVFPDRGAEHLSNIVRQRIEPSSNGYLVVSHHLNGLQPGNEDVATRMDEDTVYARLVVDFSSLAAGEKGFLQRPKAWLRTGNDDKSLGLEEYEPLVYSVSKENLKQGQVMRIDFAFDWNQLDNAAAATASES